MLFEEEKHRILDAIEHYVARIEHIGSTAVPGLGAKPIIDILVAIHNLGDSEHCISPLKSIGYEYIPEYEKSIPERRYFRKGKFSQEQHYHLHMVELTSGFWKRHLLFRDYLRTHPKMAQQYFDMKKNLALKYGIDHKGYTDAKTDFIQKTLARSKTPIQPDLRDPTWWTLYCKASETDASMTSKEE
jgi:GrpB-like predicted nucleotidyltransferase (UPF0157 family)